MEKHAPQQATMRPLAGGQSAAWAWDDALLASGSRLGCNRGIDELRRQMQVEASRLQEID
jgi:hypothetical protein